MNGFARLLKFISRIFPDINRRNPYKIVCYFENWAQYRPAEGKFAPADIDPLLLTNINYAFAFFGFLSANFQGPKLTGDYKIQPVEWNDQTQLYPAIQNLKEINAGLKTHLSIGGWSFNDPGDTATGQYTYQLFSKMASSSAGRKEFISSAIAYARQFQFDGIDIDWEYPGDLSRGGTIDDFNNFTTLLKEFRTTIEADAVKPHLLLTVATPSTIPSGLPAEYQSTSKFFQWIKQWVQYTDWLNVMAYDYHGPFQGETVTGVNAPLLRDSTPGGMQCIKNTIDNYLGVGIPSNKIVLGMPFYGHSFSLQTNPSAGKLGLGEPFSAGGEAGPMTGQRGFLAYYEIIRHQPSLQEVFDKQTSTPFGYNSDKLYWVSYDNAASITEKSHYVINNQLAGAMVWAIGLDDFRHGFPLLRAIKNTLNP